MSLWIQHVFEMAGVLAIGTVFLGLGPHPAELGQEGGERVPDVSKIILRDHDSGWKLTIKVCNRKSICVPFISFFFPFISSCDK